MEGFKDHTNLFNGYIDNFINDLNDNSVYEPIKYLSLIHISEPRDTEVSRMPSSA